MSSPTYCTRTLVRLSLVLAVFVVSAGCASTEGRVGLDQPPPGTVSVYTVADRLSLDVVASEPDHVVLRDALNSVLFFGGEQGRAYANGMPIAVGAPVVRVDGTYYVPEQLVDEVRAALRHVPQAHPPVTVEPEPGEPPEPRPRPRARGQLVVVDPGHGGRDPGATAVTGNSEKWINLSVAKKLAGVLEKRGYNVRQTRTKDVFVDLNRRAEIANQAGADLFVSIHADACGTPSERGSSVYVCREASARSCATADALVRALEDGPLPARGLRRADFRVLVRTRCPAVLVECGFLTNRKDTALLLRRDIQDRIAETLADGIDEAAAGW